MIDDLEVIFTSCDGDKTSSVNVWNVQTGTNLITYKAGGFCATNGLSLLGSEYVIAAEKNKPMLKVWPVNSQLPLNSPRLLCPGTVTTAAVNPDKCHIAVTVREKLHIYSVSSGKLLGSGERHYQPICVLKWSADGNIVACGGEDGLVTVWLLSSLITVDNIEEGEPEPHYVFSDHTFSVTDICITPEGGLMAYLISVSSDKTCKIYHLSNGDLHLSLVFDTMLTAVCTNKVQSEVFLGTSNGDLLQFNLHSSPRTKEYHLNTEEKSSKFIGHTKAITCLSSSLCGELLLSGSSDRTARIWDIVSKQCKRTLFHKGPITNAFFTVASKQMFNNDLKLSIHLSSFKKFENDETERLCIYTNFDIKSNRSDNYSQNHITYKTQVNNDVETLQTINKKLYKFAVNCIFQQDKEDVEDAENEDSICNEKSLVEGSEIVKNSAKGNKKGSKDSKKEKATQNRAKSNRLVKKRKMLCE